MDEMFQIAEASNRKIEPPLNSRLFMYCGERQNINSNNQAPKLGMVLLNRNKLKIEV